jgi:uncharacterized Fe-S cluster-containing radical SAM superfamily enzyme
MTIRKNQNSVCAAKHSEHIRNMAVRKSFENWLAASQRAKTLRLRGFYVSVPAPRLGHPQFILITSKSDNLIQSEHFGSAED